MSSLQTALVATLRTHALRCGLIASPTGEVLATEGDFNIPEFRGLVGPSSDDWVTTTSEGLSSRFSWVSECAQTDMRLLPQMACQGDTLVLITKPAEGLLAILGGPKTGRDVFGLHAFSKAIHATLRNEIAKVSRTSG